VLDLRSVLDTMKAPDYQKVLKYGDMEFYFKPLTYKDLNDNNQTQFNEQRALQTINSVDTSEEDKISAMSRVLKKITEITVNAMALSIAAVKTPSALVTEREFIDDLLKNCDRKLFSMIRDHVLALKASGEIQPMPIKCRACGHEYQQAITLDMSSFFADAS
jgi:hypothetical protein